MGDGNLSEVLGRLGTVKNPVLLSSSMFSSGMLWFGRQLVENPLPIPALTGVAMVVLSVFVFLSGVGFYAYAFLRLPASAQERMFLTEAAAMLEQHRKATARIRHRPARAPQGTPA